MNDLQRLALAALAHDLPDLMEKIDADVQWVVDLTRLDDHPALKTMRDQAEAYARAGGTGGAPVAPRPLISIFSRVQLHDPAEPALHYCRFAPLPATDQSQTALFPTQAADASGLADHVKQLVKELAWLGSHVDLGRFDRVYPHLLAVLQSYGWCLPAHDPDVALFDHARLASAIAVCLYRYHQADLSAAAVEAAQGAERFCLLVGDLSGIQDYIFDIATIGAGGVARRLRARSFYLSVLSDVLSHQIARRFELPLGNVVMSSGGKFFVLLPALSDVATQIQGLREEIDTWLRATFNGEIAVNLAHQCFAGAEFQAGSLGQSGFGDVLGELSRKLARAKRLRGQSILVDGGGWRQGASVDEDAFVVKRDFWGVGDCQSCGKFPAQSLEKSPERLCVQCERDKQLGKKLPAVRYVAYYRHPAARDDALPMPFDCSVRVLAEGELGQAGEPYLLAKLNDPRIHELAGQAGSFRYLANYVPADEHKVPLTFDKIAKAPDPKAPPPDKNAAASDSDGKSPLMGRVLLGYLKADVDYLGTLFAQGLRRDAGGYDTAAHVAALSRELDLFFSGWIQHLLSQMPAYRQFYTIFSGGDDLFLVGPWHAVAALACTINDRLAEFAGHNPAITISAGVLFTKERYPISRAARDAEEVLELSKEGSLTHAGKRNQLTILGDTFAWTEAADIFGEIARLRGWAGALSSAFLYDLIEYWQFYRLWTREQKVEGLRYKALFAYNIARNLRRGNQDLYRWADELMQSLHGGRESLTMRHLGLIATYLLFARRERRDDKDRPES